MILEYKEGKDPVSNEGKVGEYLGSGEGVVRGRINGTVHWSLFEAQSAEPSPARDEGKPYAERTASCLTNRRVRTRMSGGVRGGG